MSWTPLPRDTSGTLFTFTIVHHTSLPALRGEVPYAVGIVTIDGTDIRLVGRVRGNLDALRVGDRLRPVFRGEATDPVIDWTV
ncbi:Zn-ribbon domain-containing OB-fold protein [Actinophytocola sp.]|uniref:Zn-ribbon domain-containing OB-fold protein n=1 Tax=Actinophytocola sp. TaxID=1872138 RepID=UPI003D6ABA94